MERDEQLRLAVQTIAEITKAPLSDINLERELAGRDLRQIVTMVSLRLGVAVICNQDRLTIRRVLENFNRALDKPDRLTIFK